MVCSDCPITVSPCQVGTMSLSPTPGGESGHGLTPEGLYFRLRGSSQDQIWPSIGGVGHFSKCNRSNCNI